MSQQLTLFKEENTGSIKIQTVKSFMKSINQSGAGYVESMWLKFIAQRNNTDLCGVIETCIIEEYQQKAWDLLFSRNPTIIYWYHIIEHCSGKYAEMAFQELLKQDPSNHYLKLVIIYARSLEDKNRAGELLLEKKPNQNELCAIIMYYSDEHAEKAWQKLLSWKFIKDELEFIAKHCPRFRERAEAVFREREKARLGKKIVRNG